MDYTLSDLADETKLNAFITSITSTSSHRYRDQPLLQLLIRALDIKTRCLRDADADLQLLTQSTDSTLQLKREREKVIALEEKLKETQQHLSDEVSRERNECNKRIEESERINASLSRQVEEYKQMLQENSQVEEYKRIVKEKNSRLNQVLQELVEKEDENRMLSVEVEGIARELEVVLEAMDGVKLDREAYEKRLVEKEMRVKELEFELKGIKGNDKVERLEQELNAMIKETETLVMERYQLKKRIDELENDNVAVEELKRLRETFVEKEMRVKTLETELEEYKNVNKELAGIMQDVESLAVKKNLKVNDGLAVKYSELVKKYKELRAQHKAVVKQLNQNEALIVQITANDKMDTDVTQMMLRLAVRDKDIEEKTGEINQLHKELDAYIVENSVLRGKLNIDSSKRIADTNGAYTKQRNNEMNQMRLLVKTLQGEVEQLEEERIELKSKLRLRAMESNAFYVSVPRSMAEIGVNTDRELILKNKNTPIVHYTQTSFQQQATESPPVPLLDANHQVLLELNSVYVQNVLDALLRSLKEDSFKITKYNGAVDVKLNEILSLVKRKLDVIEFPVQLNNNDILNTTLIKLVHEVEIKTKELEECTHLLESANTNIELLQGKICSLYEEFVALKREGPSVKGDNFYKQQLMVIDKVFYEINANLYYLYKKEMVKNNELLDALKKSIRFEDYQKLLDQYNYLAQKFSRLYSSNDVDLMKKQILFLTDLVNRSDEAELKRELVELQKAYQQVQTDIMNNQLMKDLNGQYVGIISDMEMRYKEIVGKLNIHSKEDSEKCQLNNRINELEYSNNQYKMQLNTLNQQMDFGKYVQVGVLETNRLNTIIETLSSDLLKYMNILHSIKQDSNIGFYQSMNTTVAVLKNHLQKTTTFDKVLFLNNKISLLEEKVRWLQRIPRQTDSLITSKNKRIQELNETVHDLELQLFKLDNVSHLPVSFQSLSIQVPRSDIPSAAGIGLERTMQIAHQMIQTEPLKSTELLEKKLNVLQQQLTQKSQLLAKYRMEISESEPMPIITQQHTVVRETTQNRFHEEHYLLLLDEYKLNNSNTQTHLSSLSVHNSELNGKVKELENEILEKENAVASIKREMEDLIAKNAQLEVNEKEQQTKIKKLTKLVKKVSDY